MVDIKDEAVVFQTDYADRPAGHEDNVAAETENFIPYFEDIRMERVVCRGCSVAVKARGRVIRDIRLKDCTFFYNDAACDIEREDMVSFDNVTFHTFE